MADDAQAELEVLRLRRAALAAAVHTSSTVMRGVLSRVMAANVSQAPTAPADTEALAALRAAARAAAALYAATDPAAAANAVAEHAAVHTAAAQLISGVGGGGGGGGGGSSGGGGGGTALSFLNDLKGKTAQYATLVRDAVGYEPAAAAAGGGEGGGGGGGGGGGAAAPFAHPTVQDHKTSLDRSDVPAHLQPSILASLAAASTAQPVRIPAYLFLLLMLVQAVTYGSLASINLFCFSVGLSTIAAPLLLLLLPTPPPDALVTYPRFVVYGHFPLPMPHLTFGHLMQADGVHPHAQRHVNTWGAFLPANVLSHLCRTTFVFASLLSAMPAACASNMGWVDVRFGGGKANALSTAGVSSAWQSSWAILSQVYFFIIARVCAVFVSSRHLWGYVMCVLGRIGTVYQLNSSVTVGGQGWGGMAAKTVAVRWAVFVFCGVHLFFVSGYHFCTIGNPDTLPSAIGAFIFFRNLMGVPVTRAEIENFIRLHMQFNMRRVMTRDEQLLTKGWTDFFNALSPSRRAEVQARLDLNIDSPFYIMRCVKLASASTGLDGFIDFMGAIGTIESEASRIGEYLSERLSAIFPDEGATVVTRVVGARIVLIPIYHGELTMKKRMAIQDIIFGYADFNVVPFDIVADLSGNAYGSLLRAAQVEVLQAMLVTEYEEIFKQWKLACSLGGIVAQDNRRTAVLLFVQSFNAGEFEENAADDGGEEEEEEEEVITVEEEDEEEVIIVEE